MTISIGTGITIEGGMLVGQAGSLGPSGSNGVVGFTEMTAGGTQSQWLQDPTATMLANGFIINNGALTGVAINYLTNDNKTFFSTYGTGNKTATWSAGSSVTTPMTVNVTQNNSNGQPELVFFMPNVTSFPATFIFPVTFS
jgi:hypothetical protein